jgi:hypothetical protein
MPEFAQDDLDRARLDWPEAALIDLIKETYEKAPNVVDAAAPARLHARFLRSLVESDGQDLVFPRLELIACCAARGIGIAAIEAADHAAFRELITIVEARFRTSARMRLHFARRLHAALGRLPSRAVPRKEPAQVQVLATARSQASVSRMQIGGRVAVNG